MQMYTTWDPSFRFSSGFCCNLTIATIISRVACPLMRAARLGIVVLLKHMHYANSRRMTKYPLSYFMLRGAVSFPALFYAAFKRRSFSSIIPYFLLVFLTRQSRFHFSRARYCNYLSQNLMHRSIAVEWLDIARDVTFKEKFIWKSFSPFTARGCCLPVFLEIRRDRRGWGNWKKKHIVGGKATIAIGLYSMPFCSIEQGSERNLGCLYSLHVL